MSGCHTEYIRGKGNDVCHHLNDAGAMMVQVGLKPQRLLEKWRGKNVDSMTISYGCVGSLEEDWENIYDIAKEADRRMYESKARYYRDSGIDRRK